jgi:hypothetical protein
MGDRGRGAQARVPFEQHAWTCAHDHLQTVLAQRATAAGAHSTVRQASGIVTSRARTFGDWLSIVFRSPLRDYTGDPPFMVYGIGDPATGGVIVPTDATRKPARNPATMTTSAARP